GGTLSGTDSFVANGLLTLQPFAVLSSSGAVDAYGGVYLKGGDVTISGAALNNHAAATSDRRNARFDTPRNTAAPINLAGASVTAGGSPTGGSSLGSEGTAVAFNNAGTFTCSIGTSARLSIIGVPLANTGSVSLTQGNLGLAAASNSGVVTVAPATALGV